MKARTVTVAELADALKISYQGVRKILLGPGAFTAKNNEKAARFLNVSSRWLATGSGRMEQADDADEVKTVNEQDLRRALRLIRNQLAHAQGPAATGIADALALLARVPDSDRAYEEAVTALLAAAPLPSGEDGHVPDPISLRGARLARQFDALGPTPLADKAYAQSLQLLLRLQEEAGADPKPTTPAPRRGQKSSPADAE